MKKYINKEKTLIIIILFILLIDILNGFKIFKVPQKNNINDNVYLAFFNGNQQLTTMPQKGNTENLGFEHAECNNGASVEWNYQNWAPIVTNMTKNKTKCNLYFAQNIANDYLFKLSETDTTTLAYDDTNDENLRYIGSSPNNYIDIGDKDSNGNKILWRIIGVMNNVPVVDESSETHLENLVKIIRGSIGKLSWDSSASGVNNGYGVNEWGQADVMKLLNPEDIYTKDSEIGNSLYWNKTSGQCYNGSKNSQKDCNFTVDGLTESVKDKIAKVRWNTGTVSDDTSISSFKYNPTASYMYQAERSNHNGKEQCRSGQAECNDVVERTTTWDGYIGLMYPSDYGYAVGGNVRTECLAKTMLSWSDSSPDCKSNNWIRDIYNNQWTITSYPNLYEGHFVFFIGSAGQVAYNQAYGTNFTIKPTAYLKSSVKIKPNSASNYGSQSNPFVIEGVN